jgi:hypothetical protein
MSKTRTSSRQIRSDDRAIISRGVRALAERGEHARERFLAYAQRHGGLSRKEAERALEAYKKHRVIRLDHVTGEFHVKHGGFLDRETLRRAAGLDE